MPWYPSAKACPAAIKPTVQCFFPTLYQVLLFDFSSFGEKLFFCLRGYRRAIARSAVQKQPERRALRPQARFGAQPPQAALGAEIGCSSVHPPPNRRRMGGGSNPAPPPTGYRRAIAQSAVQKTAGAQSAAPAGAFRSATAAGGTWRGDRMFLCSPAAEQAANGWRRQPDLTAGEAANPAPPPTSYRHAAQSWHLT